MSGSYRGADCVQRCADLLVFKDYNDLKDNYFNFCPKKTYCGRITNPPEPAGGMDHGMGCGKGYYAIIIVGNSINV